MKLISDNKLQENENENEAYIFPFINNDKLKTNRYQDVLFKSNKIKFQCKNRMIMNGLLIKNECEPVLKK